MKHYVSLYHWLRDSQDSRLKWIFTRLQVEGRADISDSTMTYFLLTGDEYIRLDYVQLDYRGSTSIAGSSRQ